MCQFIDTRAIYDWLQVCSCSLPYWISFLSETAASSALAGRYEKFRQIGTANRAQTGLLPSAMYTGLPPVALVPVLAPASARGPQAGRTCFDVHHFKELVIFSRQISSSL